MLDAIIRTRPAPTEEPPIEVTDNRGEIVEMPPDASGPLVAQVFKTTADPFVGRLTDFRVWSGTIKAHDQVWNASRGEEERIAQVFYIKGKEQEPVDEVRAGEITGQWPSSCTPSRETPSAPRNGPSPWRPSSSPSRTLPVAVEPASKADLDKLLSSALTPPPGGGPHAARRAQTSRPASSPAGARARTRSRWPASASPASSGPPS